MESTAGPEYQSRAVSARSDRRSVPCAHPRDEPSARPGRHGPAPFVARKITGNRPLQLVLMHLRPQHFRDFSRVFQAFLRELANGLEMEAVFQT
jgi:hypothetical protein